MPTIPLCFDLVGQHWCQKIKLRHGKQPQYKTDHNCGPREDVYEPRVVDVGCYLRC